MNIYIPVPASSSCLVMSTVSPNMSYRGFFRPTTPATQGPGKKESDGDAMIVAFSYDAQWFRAEKRNKDARCLARHQAIQEISVRRHIFSTNPLHILRPYKHSTDEFISNRASQQAGGVLFSCINKSTQRHIRVPFHSPLFFLSLQRSQQPALLPEPESRSTDA